MNINDIKIRMKCAHISMEVFLDDVDHYLTGYHAFSQTLPTRGAGASGYYTITLKLHESFMGHRLLIMGTDFARDLLIDEVLLHQADEQGDIHVNLCEGQLIPALNREEWMLSCSAQEALDFLYQDINNLYESSPAYVNACWQLMMDGNTDCVEALADIQKLTHSAKIKNVFDVFCKEFYDRFGYPQEYAMEDQADEAEPLQPAVDKKPSPVKEVSEEVKPYETTEDGLILIPNEMRMLKEEEWKYWDILAEVEAEFDDDYDWDAYEEREAAKEAAKAETENAEDKPVKNEGPTSYKTEEELVIIPNEMRRVKEEEWKYWDILAEVEAEFGDDYDWDAYEEREAAKEAAKAESEKLVTVSESNQGPTSYKTESELVYMSDDMRRLGNITNKYADILAEVEAEMAEEDEE